ncbi:hypothetical protein VTJ83DRAFT_750 [Remersonia thermophila]|uniref:Secreted protein n=1 Tax=Remersonia thermophila TaxID=72144 RepID=A0ABR4DPC3_9PEZI
MQLIAHLLNLLAFGALLVQASVLPGVDQCEANPLLHRQNYKPCNDGEIGVGTTQRCSIARGCTREVWAVFDNKCRNNLAEGTRDLCKKGFSKGWGVTCLGATPSVVRGPAGQKYGYCYNPEHGFCGQTTGRASVYNHVHFCCRPLSKDGL